MVGLEDVEAETAQAREDAWIAPYARAILSESNVSAVVRGGLDPPMCADCLRCADGAEWFVRDIECGFCGATQQPGLGAAGVDNTLDTEDGSDMRFPVGVVEFAVGVEDGDGAAFVATASGVMAMAGTQRLGSGGDLADCLEQGRLVALDLDDQGDAGLPGDLEVFF